MPPVLRIVGPPGSGKTLLIVSLVEALRSRGHRVATVAPRRGGATLIVLSNGGRVTMERALPVEEIATVVASIDPSAHLVLAEDYDTPGTPAIAIAPRGAPRATSTPPDALATVTSEDVEATFARHGPGDGGPGETNGLVDLVEREVLGVTREEVTAPVRRGWFGRLLGR